MGTFNNLSGVFFAAKEKYPILNFSNSLNFIYVNCILFFNKIIWKRFWIRIVFLAIPLSILHLA